MQRAPAQVRSQVASVNQTLLYTAVVQRCSDPERLLLKQVLTSGPTGIAPLTLNIVVQNTFNFAVVGSGPV
jgi:hypothetical protein